MYMQNTFLISPSYFLQMDDPTENIFDSYEGC